MHSSACILLNPGHVSRACRNGTTPGNIQHAVRYPRENGPVLIVGTTASPTCGIMGTQETFNKQGSTGSAETGDTEKFDTSIDENLADNGDSTPIFSNLIG